MTGNTPTGFCHAHINGRLAGQQWRGWLREWSTTCWSSMLNRLIDIAGDLNGQTMKRNFTHPSIETDRCFHGTKKQPQSAAVLLSSHDKARAQIFLMSLTTSLMLPTCCCALPSTCCIRPLTCCVGFPTNLERAWTYPISRRLSSL